MLRLVDPSFEYIILNLFHLFDIFIINTLTQTLPLWLIEEKALLETISKSKIPPAGICVMAFVGGGSFKLLGPCIHYLIIKMNQKLNNKNNDI